MKLEDVFENGIFVREEIGGVPVEHDDEIAVIWPDGHAETVRAVVTATSQGRARARANVAYHGALTAVWLNRAVDARHASRCSCTDGTCPVCEARFRAAPRKSYVRKVTP